MISDTLDVWGIVYRFKKIYSTQFSVPSMLTMQKSVKLEHASVDALQVKNMSYL